MRELIIKLESRYKAKPEDGVVLTDLGDFLEASLSNTWIYENMNVKVLNHKFNEINLHMRQ